MIAGAGSGKTRVLTHRVAHLISAVGVKPNEILAITFTNKAAGEMRERLGTMLGPVARAIWILTFHSACGRILRAEAERLGYRSNFTIYDSADQVRLVKQCLEELDKDPKRFVPRGIHVQISNAKNHLLTPAIYAERVASFYDQTVAEVYALYQKRLHASNAVDFDDMLMLTVEVARALPRGAQHWQNAFRYVLVDEYQDTNHAQYRFLQILGEHHHNVCAVGDPDQSIYAFRGADIRNILEFERDFPETRTIALEQNYRSTNAILESANAVIAQQQRAEGEAALVGARRRRSGARDRGRGRARRGALRRGADRRARRGGLLRQRDRDLLPDERAVAGDRADAAALADRLPGDRRPALLRARRGEGRDRLPAGARQPDRRGLAAADREQAAPRGSATRRSRGSSPTRRRTGSRSTTRSAIPRRPGLGTPAVKAVTGLKNLLDSLRSAAQELEVPELIQEVLDRTGTIEAYEAERTIEARGRIENLEAFVDGAREYQQQAEEPTLSGFLQEISLFSDAGRARRREVSNVTLMTIHNAKGLEFRAVFVVGVEEEIFPSARSIEEQGIEEERRLFYVGLTRARGAADAHARLVAPALGTDDAQPALALPRRAARPARRARAAAAPRRGATTARPRRRATSSPGPSIQRSRPATGSATARSARA